MKPTAMNVWTHHITLCIVIRLAEVNSIEALGQVESDKGPDFKGSFSAGFGQPVAEILSASRRNPVTMIARIIRSAMASSGLVSETPL